MPTDSQNPPSKNHTRNRTAEPAALSGLVFILRQVHGSGTQPLATLARTSIIPAFRLKGEASIHDDDEDTKGLGWVV